MENLKTKNIIAAIALSLVLASCKAPMATVIKDEVKENIPQNFNQENSRMLIITAEQHLGDSFLLILIW
jgi:PBP1b-binding outer membrane lipoprotein LpoB